MRLRTALTVAVVSLVAATGCHRHKKSGFSQAPPAYPGSYAQSCRNIVQLSGGFISAECANGKGQFDISYLQAAACKGDIGNSAGLLICNGAVASKTAPPALASDGGSASDMPASGAPGAEKP
jgi:hypothetical protein